MKALCVKEPWASMLVDGFKTAEIRSRRTSYRGPLLIVASRVPDFQALRTWTVFAAKIPIYRLGQAIGIVWLDGCVPFTHELQSRAHVLCKGDDKFAWLINSTRSRWIEPQPIQGRLGIFDLPNFKEITNIQ